MKRAPIVIAGTVAGLVAVLEFHTTPVKLKLAGGESLPSAAPASAGGTTQPASGESTPAKAARPGATASSTVAPAGASATTRTATGSRINYNYGVLSVKVTVSGHRITKVSIAYLDDAADPRSQMIDEQAIPVLEQQALQAQSANIQGVSGASFTSEGFEQSLQSALRSLDI
ncbi:MAG TPA: FMN-binding protein [Streptosporangiaceae bacterium]|nr:FMN-binding protein [Streptosporangiaceae bacterium]